jgi:sigma-B regulation protein RsbU (phosphoserine phosphatase)
LEPSKQVGTAYVLIAARRISEIKQGLMMTIAIFTIIIIAAGVVVSFFINKKLLAPILELSQDIEIVGRGDFTHKTKVKSHDEIGVLARTFDKMTKNLLEARESEMEHKSREHEVKIASEIKDNLLPKTIPAAPGFELTAYHNPSKEMGADYYDFIPMGDRHLGIITGSVAGQGIPAFMIMSMARSLIRAEAERETSPAKILCKVNATLAQDIRKGMYVSVLFAILDKEEKKLTVASAGHGPMVIYRAEGQKLTLVHPDGISLGLDKGAMFNERLKEEKVSLEAGDRILLHTEGVLKLTNESEQEMGEKRLYMTVKKEAPKNSEAFLNILSHSVNKFLGKAPQKQDVTLVTLKRIK